MLVLASLRRCGRENPVIATILMERSPAIKFDANYTDTI